MTNKQKWFLLLWPPVASLTLASVFFDLWAFEALFKGLALFYIVMTPVIIMTLFKNKTKEKE